MPGKSEGRVKFFASFHTIPPTSLTVVRPPSPNPSRKGRDSPPFIKRHFEPRGRG